MKLRDDLVLRHIGEEYIIIDPGQDMVDASNVFTLNKTAAFIWKKLRGKSCTAVAITDLLIGHYVVSEEQAQEDALSVLRFFKKHHLLTS